jgi:hypothetical protein
MLNNFIDQIRLAFELSVLSLGGQYGGPVGKKAVDAFSRWCISQNIMCVNWLVFSAAGPCGLPPTAPFRTFRRRARAVGCQTCTCGRATRSRCCPPLYSPRPSERARDHTQRHSLSSGQSSHRWCLHCTSIAVHPCTCHVCGDSNGSARSSTAEWLKRKGPTVLEQGCWMAGLFFF